MPAVEVIFYQDAQGKLPRLIEWLDALSPKPRVKCLVRLKPLEDFEKEAAIQLTSFAVCV